MKAIRDQSRQSSRWDSWGTVVKGDFQGGKMRMRGVTSHVSAVDSRVLYGKDVNEKWTVRRDNERAAQDSKALGVGLPFYYGFLKLTH